MRVLVLGGGVIGLTTALRLIESGADVTVRAAMSWEDTASAVAAAIWYPFRAYPADRVRAWSTRSFEVFADLAGSPATGVRMVPVADRPAAAG
jgi:D-amino-acid oxidase